MSNEITEYELASREAMKERAEDEPALQTLAVRLLGEFSQAKLDRKDTEERWLKDLRQYRGVYDPDELLGMGATRSKVFVRKTRVKVKTIDSRVGDLLFPAGSEKNWEVGPTPVPSISKETLQEVVELLAKAKGSEPDEDEVKAAVIEMSKKKAAGMSKAIEDQLTESRYKAASVAAIHSGHLYGTGVLKGPLVEKRVRTRFVEQTVVDKDTQLSKKRWVMRNESYIVPFVEAVPLWSFYPDMTATTIDKCRYTYELHRMTKAKLFDLTKRKTFSKIKITDYLSANPRGASIDEYFDTEVKSMGDRQAKQGSNANLYDVLERWGYVDGCDLKEAGVKVPDDRLQESFFANIWLLPNGTVIKAALQPINGVTWPYHMYYFDKDETSIFGEGLGAVMRDDQKMLNAATRMILDNGALTSGPMLEVMIDELSSTEKADEIYPWKVWLRKAGARPDVQAVRSIQLPNSLAQLQAIAQMFEANADETTAIPRYMSGENATQGAAGTAAGMSMLMGAANIVIKDLITAWDEGITRPFLEALYRWNMQFNPDPSIKGDFDVKARGTASLVAKEVRAQRLDQFAIATNNPMDAPFIKRHAMIKQRAEANELSDVIKTEEEVKAEQESEDAQTQKQLQLELAKAQVQVEQGKASKLMADAELAKRKLDEITSNIELIIATTIEKRVAAIYAGLQAGGVATNSPYIAPAGDEILRSAGFKDLNGDPSIAQLNGPPVQQAQGTQQLMQRGQGFAVQPRGDQPAMAPQGDVSGTTNEAPVVDQPDVQADVPPNLQPQTGQVGAHGGIETTRIEP